MSELPNGAMPGYNQGVIRSALAKAVRAAADDLERGEGSGRTYNAAIEWPTLITIENEEGGPAALRAVADQLDSSEPVVPLSEVREALLAAADRSDLAWARKYAEALIADVEVAADSERGGPK